MVTMENNITYYYISIKHTDIFSGCIVTSSAMLAFARKVSPKQNSLTLHNIIDRLHKSHTSSSIVTLCAMLAIARRPSMNLNSTFSTTPLHMSRFSINFNFALKTIRCQLGSLRIVLSFQYSTRCSLSDIIPDCIDTLRAMLATRRGILHHSTSPYS
jgi:hypothetical protein